VHTPPRVRGGLAARGAALIFGVFLFALAIVCQLESKLGLSPWDTLHQGIAKHSPLSFGVANICVGAVVLGIAWALGAKVGIGTVANVILVGATRRSPTPALAGVGNARIGAARASAIVVLIHEFIGSDPPLGSDVEPIAIALLENG